MQPFDPVCYDAYTRLLALPDPPEMIGLRGHSMRYVGTPNRRETLFPYLLNRWLQHHYLAVDGDEQEPR